MKEGTIKEWWKANEKNFQSYGEAVKACAAQLGVAEKTVYNQCSSLRTLPFSSRAPKNGTTSPALTRPPILLKGKMTGLSEVELRSKYDALYKLEKAVGSLTRGQFIPEQEFRSAINLEPSKFRSKADMPQFDAFKGKVAGVTYWAHPADIKKLKNEGVLQ